MESVDETNVDFIALLPVDITQKILNYLVPRRGRLHPRDLCNCCLVSKTWYNVVEKSWVWSKVARNCGHQHLSISKYMRTEDSMTPRSRLIQLRKRILMEDLFQKVVKDEFEFDSSLIKEDEDERQPDLLEMEYEDGIAAIGFK